MHDVNILILDEDRFFVNGLQQYLAQVYDLTKHTLNFTYRFEDCNKPTVIFFTLATCTFLPQELLLAPKPHFQIICIANRKIIEEGQCTILPWVTVLHRESALHQVANLMFNHSTTIKKAPAWTLTYEEITVLQLLAEGVQAVSAGEILGMTQKAVSFHKVSAMRKLGIRSYCGLLHWIAAFGHLCFSCTTQQSRMRTHKSLAIKSQVQSRRSHV